jgi:hypothetical protein
VVEEEDPRLTLAEEVAGVEVVDHPLIRCRLACRRFVVVCLSRVPAGQPALSESLLQT